MINHYKHKAFTMIELIFVIVLIGILTNVGLTFLPDNRLINDTNFLIMKIKAKQKGAIGYDIYKSGKPWQIPTKNSLEYNLTCIELNTTILEQNDNKSQTPYKFSSTISVDKNKTICFDEDARPYHQNSSGGEQLLLTSLDINLTLKGQTKKLSIMPVSGFVHIK